LDTFFGIRKLAKRFSWPVVTLGMFDGVHLGHQKVIQKVLSLAGKEGGGSIVITFDRHPRSYISQSAQSCITSLEHRLVLFERLGVDETVVLKFNHEIAETSAEEFINKIIHGCFGAKAVVLGFNCAFGKDRRGNASMVCSFAKECGFKVFSCDPVKLEGEVISSTAIRKNIVEGNLEKANKMLGRRVSVLGTVIRGDGRGRELGYPTANLNLHHEIKPPSGVYATKVFLDDMEYNALTNIGTRPTFEGSTQDNEPLVEVHIIDFDESIYGIDLEVQFLYKLREEIKFQDVNELKLQLRRDKVSSFERFSKKILTE